MAEAINTITVSTRGEGSTQRTNFEALIDTKTRRDTPGVTTRTRKPVVTTAIKKAHESVSRQEAAESTQQQTEDYGITVTFKMRINNFLGDGAKC